MTRSDKRQTFIKRRQTRQSCPQGTHCPSRGAKGTLWGAMTRPHGHALCWSLLTSFTPWCSSAQFLFAAFTSLCFPVPGTDGLTVGAHRRAVTSSSRSLGWSQGTPGREVSAAGCGRGRILPCSSLGCCNYSPGLERPLGRGHGGSCSTLSISAEPNCIRGFASSAGSQHPTSSLHGVRTIPRIAAASPRKGGQRFPPFASPLPPLLLHRAPGGA